MKTVIQIGNELKVVPISEALDNISAIKYTGTEAQCNEFVNIAE
jgi:hypothetical protein